MILKLKKKKSFIITRKNWFMYSSFIPANFFINTFPVYVMHNSKQAPS